MGNSEEGINAFSGVRKRRKVNWIQWETVASNDRRKIRLPEVSFRGNLERVCVLDGVAIHSSTSPARILVTPNLPEKKTVCP